MGSPALMIQPPQIQNPLTTLQGIASLRSAQTENLLRQQQIQESQARLQDTLAQNAIRQRQVQGRATLNGILRDPAEQSKIAGGDYSSLLGSNADPADIDAYIKTLDAHRGAVQNYGVDQAKAAEEARGDFADALSQTDATKEGAADILNQKIAELSKTSPLHAQVAAGFGKFTDGPDLPQQFTDALDRNNLYSAYLGDRAKQTEAAGKATEAKAKGETAAAINTMMQRGIAAQGAPTGGAHPVDAVMGGMSATAPGVAAGFRSEYDQALPDPADPFKNKNAVLQRAAQYVAEHAPETIAANAKQAAANAQATAPIEVQKATQVAAATAPIEINKAVQTQQTLAKLSPDAFAGIVNPSARNEAMTTAAKLYTDASTALNQSQQVLDTIKAEQGGNKAAASAITVDQALSLISNSRAMGPVMHQVSSQSGNLMDKIEGRLRGIGGTDSLPPDVVKDIASLATIQQRAAQNNFQSGLQTLKMRGVDTTKIPVPTMPGAVPDPVKKALAGIGPGIHTLSDGSKWMKAADGSITAQ